MLGEIPSRCATNSFDSDWNHSTSTSASRADSAGRVSDRSPASAPASDGGV